MLVRLGSCDTAGTPHRAPGAAVLLCLEPGMVGLHFSTPKLCLLGSHMEDTQQAEPLWTFFLGISGAHL